MKIHIDKSPDSGVINFCSWERLEPYLAKVFKLKKNEIITDIYVTKYGINIKINNMGECSE